MMGTTCGGKKKSTKYQHQIDLYIYISIDNLSHLSLHHWFRRLKKVLVIGACQLLVPLPYITNHKNFINIF